MCQPFLLRQDSYQFFYQNASKMRSRIDSRGPKWTILSSFTTPLISPYVTRRKSYLLSGFIAADLGPSGNSPGHQPEVSGVTACGVARWGKCRDHGSDALWPADLRVYRMFMPRCGSFDMVRVFVQLDFLSGHRSHQEVLCGRATSNFRLLVPEWSGPRPNTGTHI